VASTSITGKPVQRTLIDRLYFAGVLVKGVDGALELALGFVLLFMPTLPHRGLEAAATRVAGYHPPVGQFISNYLEGVDGSLAHLGSSSSSSSRTAQSRFYWLSVSCFGFTGCTPSP
jgi:hypothetical protein